MFLLSGTGASGCPEPSTDERLNLFCFAERYDGEVVTAAEATRYDYQLKRSGYERGLGLPARVNQFSFQPYVAPILRYDTDINGGNPDKPLQLGSLTFVGDPKLVRQEGVVVGAGIGAYGRYLVGEGRYVDYGLGASYAHSPEHDIGIERRFASVCSKNHVGNWWYLDGCMRSSFVKKNLTEETRNSISLSTAKLFTSSEDVHHEVSVGGTRVYDEDYQQNQLSVGFETIYSNGWYSAVDATIGEDVDGEIAVQNAVSASLSLPVFERSLTITASYSEADGAKLFGIERADYTTSLSVVYSVYRNIDVVAGYTETDSSINYFDEAAPSFSVRFEPIRF
ncbi:hypothetical protein [Rhodosalinus sediminis]|nr:hypothetical protein [Rhodosalinus sediminis]